MALKFQFWPVLFLNLFLLLLLQTAPSSAKYMPAVWVEDEHFGSWGLLQPPEGEPGLSRLSESLDKAGYNTMLWFVENKLIPAVRQAYGYNGTITIFVPRDIAYRRCAFDFLPPDTKILRQVVPLNLDLHTFGTNFSKDSTFPTFSQDLTNPSFELSDHIRITQPLYPCFERHSDHVRITEPEPPIDDSRGKEAEPKASINDVPITDWDLYNDGSVIVHGVPRLFEDPMDMRRKKDFEERDGDPIHVQLNNDEESDRDLRIVDNDEESDRDLRIVEFAVSESYS